MASALHSRFSKALPSAPVDVEMILPTPPKEQISITRRPIRPEKKTDSGKDLNALYNDYMRGLSLPKSEDVLPLNHARKQERKESPERALSLPPSPLQNEIWEREVPPQSMGNKISKYKNGPGNTVFPLKPRSKPREFELKDEPVAQNERNVEATSARGPQQPPSETHEKALSTLQSEGDSTISRPRYSSHSDPQLWQYRPTQAPSPALQASVQALRQPLEESKQATSLSRKEFTHSIPRGSIAPQDPLRRLSSLDLTQEQSPQSYPRLPTPEYSPSSTEAPPTITPTRPATPPTEPLLRSIKAADGFPLGIVQLKCFQWHKIMRFAPNKACPTRCMVCATPEGKRWWCTWCCLGLCEGCKDMLKNIGGDLEALVVSVTS